MDAQTDTLLLAVLPVLAILVAALLIFAKQLNEMIHKLAEQVAQDRIQQTRLEATIDRMERATKVVAHDLEASIGRADKADDSIPGASADAALRPEPKIG
jgi:cell division protein FtsL